MNTKWLLSIVAPLLPAIAWLSGVQSKPALPSAPEIQLSLGAPQVVSTYRERQRFGFEFGYTDGVMGAVADDDNYLYFGSAKSAFFSCSLGGNTPRTQGAYKLVPAPDNPLRIASARCRALLQPSGRHAGVNPTGLVGPYDRDYLGGGPVIRISDGQHCGILIVYHAEFQYGPRRKDLANLFFGTLGMAVSMDNGKSFEKLGQIVQPHPSRVEWITEFPGTALSVGDGPFILGDEAGHPVSPRYPDPEKTWIYVYYIDFERGQCGDQQCLAVARARLADVMKAAFRHDQSAVSHLFRKYHDGRFEEPAATGAPNNELLSGSYTPVLEGGFSPSIIFDPVSGNAILATQAVRQKGTAKEKVIEFRASNNLVSWSRDAIYTLNATADGFSVRYPSLVQTGSTLRLFYSRSPVGSETWPETTFMARTVTTAPANLKSNP